LILWPLIPGKISNMVLARGSTRESVVHGPIQLVGMIETLATEGPNLFSNSQG